MDAARFDRLAQLVSASSSRRRVLATLAAAFTRGLLTSVSGSQAASGKKPRHKPPCERLPDTAFRAPIATLPNNAVCSCFGLSQRRRAGIFFEDAAQGWVLTKAPAFSEGGRTEAGFAFGSPDAIPAISNASRTGVLPAGFKPDGSPPRFQPDATAAGLLAFADAVCHKAEASGKPVPRGVACVAARITFTTDLEQRVYRPDWDYRARNVSPACGARLEEFFQKVDRHEGRHVQDNQAIADWYSAEWGARVCYGCTQVAADEPEQQALAKAKLALDANVDRVINAISDAIGADSEACGKRLHKTIGKNTDDVRCDICCAEGRPACGPSKVCCGEAELPDAAGRCQDGDHTCDKEAGKCGCGEGERGCGDACCEKGWFCSAAETCVCAACNPATGLFFTEDKGQCCRHPEAFPGCLQSCVGDACGPWRCDLDDIP